LWEYFYGKRTKFPSFLFGTQTQTGVNISEFLSGFCNTIPIYYLPFFHQARGRTAFQSAVDTLPYVVSWLSTSFISSVVSNGTGHYWMMLILGPMVGAIAGGLLFTIDQRTSSSKLIGYQIILGIGRGIAANAPSMLFYVSFIDILTVSICDL
jgi:hypothetical protein